MKKIDVHLHASSAAQARENLDYLRKKGVAHAVLMSIEETDLNRDICAQVPGLHWMCGLNGENPETVFDRLAEYKEAGALGVGELCVNERMDSPFLEALFGAAESAAALGATVFFVPSMMPTPSIWLTPSV